MSAVLSHAPAQTDVGARLAFQKQLQAVTNKIHATNNCLLYTSPSPRDS